MPPFKLALSFGVGTHACSAPNNILMFPTFLTMLICRACAEKRRIEKNILEAEMGREKSKRMTEIEDARLDDGEIET